MLYLIQEVRENTSQNKRKEDKKMMTYNEIYNIKKESGLNNALIENLANENKGIKELAMKTISKLNLQTKDDVLMFIAMNI